MYIHSRGRQAREVHLRSSLAFTSLPPLPSPPCFVFLRSTTEAIYSLQFITPHPTPPLILNEIEC